VQLEPSLPPGSDPERRRHPCDEAALELAPGRDLSGADFAGLVPISTDQSILPAAGSPPSGAHFDTVTISQFLADNPRLALLGHEDLGGTGIFAPGNLIVPHAGAQAPITASVSPGFSAARSTRIVIVFRP